MQIARLIRRYIYFVPFSGKSPLLALCVSLLMFSANNVANAADLESFKDPQLKICIEKALKKNKTNDVDSLIALKCHNKDIVDVSGVNQLVGLESLSLYGNNIAYADLRPLHKLKHVNIAKNELAELHISGLGQLEDLYLFKNKLRTIDLGGLGALKKVRIMQNQLTSLNIMPLLSLEEAYLWDNKLEDLKINGLDKLTFLDVKQNPMPDELYDFYDEQEGITISHDGNSDDWK